MLKRLIILSLASAALSLTSHGETVTVTVENINAKAGKVFVALHTSDTFLSDELIDGRIIEVNGDSVSFTMSDVTPGTYALAAFHDVDDDGELDAGTFGIPKEPYGFSNNAKPRFGPPKFKAASFVVAADGAEQTIRLR